MWTEASAVKVIQFSIILIFVSFIYHKIMKSLFEISPRIGFFVLMSLLNFANSTAYASHSRRGPGYTNSKTSTCLDSVTTITIQRPLSKSVEFVTYYLNKLLVSLNYLSQSCTNMALGSSLLHVNPKLHWTVSMEWKLANKRIHRNFSCPDAF